MNIKIKIIIYYTVGGIMVSLLGLYWGYAQSAAAASFLLNPADGNYQIGDIFSVDVILNTENEMTDGAAVRSLHYDPALLEVQDANSLQGGTQVMVGNLYQTTQENSVSQGKITVSQFNTGGLTYKGAGTFASINFKVLAAGTSKITIDHSLKNTLDSNIVGRNIQGHLDILSSVGQANFTLTPPIDITAPIITKVAASNITAADGTITWITNEPSTSQVEYGTTWGYGTSTPLDAKLVQEHSVTLSKLKPGTTYSYRVKSEDAGKNLTISSNFAFTTKPAAPSDNIAPLISDVKIISKDEKTAMVAWTTNESSTSQIEYGASLLYGTKTILDENQVLAHQVILEGLKASTKYHYRVLSIDGSGNKATSPDNTFTTNEVIVVPSPDTTPPATIRDFRVQKVSESIATLTWTAVGDDGLVGAAASYDVRYNTSVINNSNWETSSKAEEKIIPVVSGTKERIAVKNLKTSTRYYFAIKAIDDSSNSGALSNIASVLTLKKPRVIDRTPPDEVTKFSSSIDGNNKTITLTWKNPGNTDFIKTIIRRKEKSEPLNRLDGTWMYEGGGTSFTDTRAKEGVKYYYKIFTADEVANYSAGVGILVEVPKVIDNDTTPPQTPKNFKATKSRKKVSLHWTPPADRDFDKVIVRRREDMAPTDTNDGQLVYEGKLSVATDASVVLGKTYYYSIFAVDKSLNYSKPATAKIILPLPWYSKF